MKKIAVRLVALFAAVAAMTVVEAVWRPGYALKSAIKWLLFGGVMVLPLWGGWKERMRWLAPRRDKALNAGLFLGAAACAAVVGGYFALRGAIDFSGVVTGLAGKEGITGQNFLFVALYICLANSFLEEAFFRGFGYLGLRDGMGEKGASALSAAAFSLYHVFILDGWFSPPVFAAMTAALFCAGLLFNRLDRGGAIYPAWCLHVGANVGINLVGCILLGVF